jgi:hypothetical protein
MTDERAGDATTTGALPETAAAADVPASRGDVTIVVRATDARRADTMVSDSVSVTVGGVMLIVHDRQQTISAFVSSHR